MNITKVRAILGNAHTTPERSRRDHENMKRIQRIVAEHYGYTVERLMDKNRAEPLVTVRQIAMVLCRGLTLASYPDIAASFGKKDHNTIRHAIDAVEAKMRGNARLTAAVKIITLKAEAAIKPAAA